MWRVILKWVSLSNFGVVKKGRIYRSSQTWFLYLLLPFLSQWLGLKAIVNLSYKPETDMQDRLERWMCKHLGIELITFPTIGPGEDGFDEAFNAIYELYLDKKKVLIHCEGGKDRTGGLVAVWKMDRLVHDGVTLTELVEDWKLYGVPGEDWLAFIFDEFQLYGNAILYKGE